MTQPTPSNDKAINFDFKCGCFIRCFNYEDGRLGAGLACCKDHEHIYAHAEDFYLSLQSELALDAQAGKFEVEIEELKDTNKILVNELHIEKAKTLQWTEVKKLRERVASLESSLKIAVDGLECIRSHQELTSGGSGASLSTTFRIAVECLKKLNKMEKK